MLRKSKPWKLLGESNRKRKESGDSYKNVGGCVVLMLELGTGREMISLMSTESDYQEPLSF